VRRQRIEQMSGAIIEEFFVTGANCILNPLRGDIDGYVDYLKKSSFDIIISNAWQTWSTDILLNNIYSIKGRKYLYSHCISTNQFFKSQPLRSLIRYFAWRPYWRKVPIKMRALDGMIFLADNGCDSRFDDLCLAKKLGVHYAVIPNTYSKYCDFSRSVMNKGNLVRNHILAVGSYDWFKGHDFVIKAYAHSEIKNKIPIKICGQRFNSFVDRLKSLSENLGVSPNYLSFHECIKNEQLISEYNFARIVVSGSYTECQPLVLLDAMATGTPFIARSSGCIPYLEGGLAVKSVEEASLAINKLICDKNKWNFLSNDGLSASRKKYSPAVVGSKLIDFIMSVRL